MTDEELLSSIQKRLFRQDELADGFADMADKFRKADLLDEYQWLHLQIECESMHELFCLGTLLLYLAKRVNLMNDQLGLLARVQSTISSELAAFRSGPIFVHTPPVPRD